jgi:hypothetical protein
MASIVWARIRLHFVHQLSTSFPTASCGGMARSFLGDGERH